MGCGSQITENNIIQQLLQGDISDATNSKDKCLWLNETFISEVAQNSKTSFQKSNKAANRSQPQYRSYFGYKPNFNNRVAAFQFKINVHEDGDVEQYRRENKAIPCLSSTAEEREVQFRWQQRPNPVDTIVEIDDLSSEMVRRESQTDTETSTNPRRAEKSLYQQVRFWQSGSDSTLANTEQPRVVAANLGGVAALEGPQIVNSFSSGSNRLSMHNKRSLDAIVPQGTTYDLLSEENRLTTAGVHVSDPDKLHQLASGDNLDECGLEVVRCATNPAIQSREATRVRRLPRDGGTMEFAKQLDERLRQLCEHQQQQPVPRGRGADPAQQQQQQLYHRSPSMPSREERRFSSRKKSIMSYVDQTPASRQQFVRLNSATNSHQTLNNLTVNGTAATNKTKSNFHYSSKPKSSEERFRIDITGRCFFSLKSRSGWNK